MDIQLQGKVVQIFDEQSGEGKNGSWKAKFYSRDTWKISKKVCITQ